MFNYEAKTYNTGSPNGYTGEPPNNWTCGFNPSCPISGNPTSYVEGQTYTITITVDDPLASCYGFQIGVIDDTNQDGAGTFAVGMGSGIVIESVTTREYVEHNALSSTGVWTFDWTAPSSNVGDITFYTSAVAGQCNNDPLDDAVYTSELNLSPACDLDIMYDMSGYVVLWNCDYDSDVPRISLNILSVTGGGGEYAITPFGQGAVSTTDIVEGEGFTYFFTEDDQMNGNIGFQIEDEFGQVCVMSPDLITQLEQIPFGIVCFGAVTCNQNVEATFAPGDIEDIYSCDTSDPTNMTVIVNATATAGGDGDYTITTLGGGTLSATSITAPAGFNYTFTQADIDNYNAGFIIDLYDFTGPVLFWDVAELCEPAPVCTAPLVVDVEENNGAALLGCDFTDPLNPQYTITVNSVTMGDGTYVVTTNGGTASATTLTSGQGFTYFISQADIDAGTVGFTIDDEMACVETFDYAASLAGTVISDNCILNCEITRDIALDGNGSLAYTCDYSGTDLAMTITVENIAGGSGTYTYSSTVGTITPVSTSSPGSFTYTVTQADIDSGNTGFTIDDGTVQCGDFESLTALFSLPVSQLCPCDVDFDYLLDAYGNLQTSCDYSGPDPQTVVTVQNVTGGSGSYTITSTTGTLSATTLSSGGSFTYMFTQAEQDAGGLGFTIDDGFGLCSESDLDIFPPDFVDNACIIACDVAFDYVLGPGGSIEATCDFTSDPPQLQIEIINVTGAAANYTVAANGGSVSSTTIAAGGGFIYTFGQPEIDAGTVGFTIEDGSGNCPFTDLSGVFSNFVVENLCPTGCDADVQFQEDANGLLITSCDYSGPTTMVVLNILGISGGSGTYTLTPIGGTLSATTVGENVPFTYSFSQTDLAAGNVGFTVNDGNGDCLVPDLNATFGGFTVDDFCPPQCNISFDYVRDGNDNILVSCNYDGLVPLIEVTVINIIGNTGNYSVTPDGGTVSTTSVGNGGTFVYTFGQAEIDASTVGFTIDDGTGACPATDLSGAFAGINVNDFCSGGCPSTSGTLSITNTDACFGEDITAEATGFVLANVQEAFVLFHNAPDPSVALPTVIYGSSNGTVSPINVTINNDGTLPATVYATTIIAQPDPADPTGINFNDPCLFISTTAEFDLNTSDIVLTVDDPICDDINETYDVPFTVAGGTGTYTINVNGLTATDLGGGSYIFEDVPSGSSFSFGVSDSFPCSTDLVNVGPVICSLMCNNSAGLLETTAPYNNDYT